MLAGCEIYLMKLYGRNVIQLVFIVVILLGLSLIGVSSGRIIFSVYDIYSLI